jgi:Zn-dependent protease with chaperone function
VDTQAEAIELLRSVLPWWAAQGIWLPALMATAACAFLGTWVAIQVAATPLRRLGPDAPWYERVRCAHPAQTVSGFALVFPAVTFGVLVGMSRGPLLSLAPGLAIGGIVLVALLASAWPRGRFQERRLGRRRSWVATLRDDWVAVLVMAPQLLIVIALACALRPPASAADAALFALAAAATGVTAFHAGLPVLRWLGAVRPAPPRLHTLVMRTAERVGVSVDRVEEVDWSIANAFALPLSRRLVFTGRCSAILDDEELCAIAAHELGHLCEPAPARAARFVSGFVLLPFGAVPLLLDAFGLPGLAIPVGILLAAVLALRPLTRHLEERADGVAHQGELTQGTYARALEKLYRDNAAPVVGERKRAPHPHLYDRLLAAGIEPPYPRPAPPSRGWKLAGTAVALACALLVAIALLLAPVIARTPSEDPVTGLALSVALRGEHRDLLALALAFDARGDASDALTVVRATGSLFPDDIAAPALEATIHSRRHECTAARHALQQAVSRSDSTDPSPDDAWILSARAWVESCRSRSTAAHRIDS